MSKLCKRILLILAVFSSFLTLFACSAIQIDTYHVELPQDKYQLRVGQEIEALPIVSKNGQECDLEVSYHSYDASIATYVDGKIVALKSGEVRIKVTLKNNSKVYATALVTVVNDDSLIVDFNYEKTMIKGTTQLLTYELLVEKNRKLTFTSSNENVATIDELGNIKAITVGTTTIETVVSSLYDEGVSKTYKLVIEVKDLTFAINYVLDGGTNSENNPNEYVPEKLPLLLENPNKSGYKFVGWYDNENFTGEAITEISAGTMGDVTLYAKWNALDYRISYELNGGTNAENPDGYDVSDLPVSLHAPSRTGYIFKGWYMGENRVLAIPVGTTGNVVVSAKWEPTTYTIDFDTNGGLPTLSSIDYTIESDSFTLQEITKAGYTFDGWYNGETKVTEITTGTYGNMTLVAKWTADLYTISYDLADGVNSPENPTSYTIESGLITLKDPTRVGYTFVGWYNGEQLVTTIDSNTLENISLTAKWTVNSYKLTFDVDGNLTEKTFKYGESVTAIENPTKVGHTFAGWSKELPVKMPANDLYVSATWRVNSYTITFDVDGNLTEKTFKYGESVTAIENPTKVGHTFAGWSKELPVKMPANDLYVSATWTVNSYDITYDLAGGINNSENPTSYTIESGLITLKNPTREGYTFLGWYNGGQLVTIIDSNTLENITLTAKWKITTDHEGTEVDPYSVDDALKVAGTLTKGNSTTDKYYIKGIVSEITELSTSYGNATFKITVDGKTILVFRAKNEGNQNFTSTDDLYVGDEVVIYGNITNYNGTLEITNCYVVSNNKVARPEPIEEPEVVDKTLQEIIDMDDATNKEASYKITVIVLGWGKSLTSYDATANKYGNMIVSDLEGLNKIVVFGATATISALVWDSTNGKYTYTNKQDFLTNAITKSINIGDTLELIVIRDSYNGNTQLNAIVTKVTPKPVVTSNIVFDLDGGICDNLPTTYEEGKELVLPTPTKDGYDFLGWEYNGTVITVIAPTMTGDLALKAKWQEEDTTKAYFKKVTDVSELTEDAMYLIVYESGEKAFAFDSSLTSKLDVAKNYKEFDITSLGILVNEESKSVIFKIAKNTDGSYAILASNGNYIYHTGTKNTLSEEKKVNNSKHTITFDANGNVILKMSSADYSVRFNSADSDMRFRYYKSGQQSISLYKYSTSTSEPSTSHKINYANLPEGTTNSNPTSYTEGETITLVDPVLAGYTFDGWFDNAECTGTKITEISGYTTDITLYAKFAKIPTHSISYKYNVDSTDITNDNPTEYAEGDSTVLKDAKLTNYAFTGWYLDSEYTNKITAIDSSWNTDIVIYGKFILDTLTETIVATATFSSKTNSKGVNSYTETWSVTCDNIAWTMKNFNNYNNGWDYVKAGSKNNASVAEIITDSTMVDAITKVVVTVDKVTASSVNSFKLIVASDANFENVIETVSLNIKKGENTFSCTTPMAKRYYKIVIDCKKASSNGIVQISKLEYYTKK